MTNCPILHGDELLAAAVTLILLTTCPAFTADRDEFEFIVKQAARPRKTKR